MKKILILGGTQFIGRNLVEQLQAYSEYEITLFNRQQTQADLFPHIKKIKGDRETSDIQQINKEQWHYIIDLSCYYPVSLKNVLDQLQNKVEKYILISSCSVYNNETNHSILRKEDAEILDCSAAQKIDRSPSSYGNRKAECERILQNSGIDYTILRPALVYGPYDPTDRLYYWLHQVKFKETLLLPENGERCFSMTYVKDLVNAIIEALCSTHSNKTCNVISVQQSSIKKVVDYAKEQLNKSPKTRIASAQFLKENKINQWTDMPLWLNADHFTYSNQKLKDDFGFEASTLKASLEETILFYKNINWPEPQYGMPEEKRLDLIEKAINL